MEILSKMCFFTINMKDYFLTGIKTVLLFLACIIFGSIAALLSRRLVPWVFEKHIGKGKAFLRIIVGLLIACVYVLLLSMALTAIVNF